VFQNDAGVIQLVECFLAKENVIGSSPITRSNGDMDEWLKSAVC
jgi:hypothetical protein